MSAVAMIRASVVIFTLLTIHSGALVVKPSQYEEQGPELEISSRHVVKLNPPNDMPAALRGRNLVIAGDSVDRYAAESLCKLYLGKATSFNLTKMNEDTRRHGAKFFDTVSGDGRGGYGCHMNEFNASLLYLHHPGVMSSPPQPSWHADGNQGNPKRHARLWTLESGTTINASTDLARMYWRRAVEDNLPKRPVILLAQSSLWDSILAKESLQKYKGAKDNPIIDFDFKPRNTDGTLSEQEARVLARWSWTQHAEAFLKAIWDSGLPVEKKVWRTNANCPFEGEAAPFVNMISHGQANEARRLIAQNRGPWRNVLLMDWRKDFNATSPGWCNGIHYFENGYMTYIQSLWDTISQ